jgi:hypothetical protein
VPQKPYRDRETTGWISAVFDDMERIAKNSRSFGPVIARLLALLVPLVLAACQHNGSGVSGY